MSAEVHTNTQLMSTPIHINSEESLLDEERSCPFARYDERRRFQRPCVRRPRRPTDFRSHCTVPVILDKLLRIGEGKILRQLEGISKAVNAIEDDFVAMSDEEL